MCWLFLFTSSSTLTFPSFYAFPNLLQPLSRILTHHARSYKQPAPGPRSSMWQPTSTPTTCWMQEEIGWFPFDLKCCFTVLEFIEYCLLKVLLLFSPWVPERYPKDGWIWMGSTLIFPLFGQAKQANGKFIFVLQSQFGNLCFATIANCKSIASHDKPLVYWIAMG